MAIITIELFKKCHTAMFFMCFWAFILLCHTRQFLLFEGFALLHWCYFLLPLKTDIKGPLLFLLKKLTYPLQTIFESMFWMYLLHLILRPPPPLLLTSHWAFPTDVNASMKQVKITEKNLLRYFLYSAIILGRGRDCIFSRDREGKLGVVWQHRIGFMWRCEGANLDWRWQIPY